MVTLTATISSIIVDIEWRDSRKAVFLIFSNGLTVPVVFHSKGWSTKAVIDFVALGTIVSAMSVMAGWDFAVVSPEAVLLCIVKCRKCMRPCVAALASPLFLLKSNSLIGPVNFVITTKCSANILSPISNSRLGFANGFSTWPFTTRL